MAEYLLLDSGSSDSDDELICATAADELKLMKRELIPEGRFDPSSRSSSWFTNNTRHVYLQLSLINLIIYIKLTIELIATIFLLIGLHTKTSHQLLNS